MKKDMQIKLLTDCPEHIPHLAQLWYDGISKHWVPGASVERNRNKLVDHLNTEQLPMAFVALHEEKPIGMVCLRKTDGIQPSLTPWLGSLVVDPNYRGRKIGEALIDVVKVKAKSFGHEKLYLLAFDPTISEWYGRLGWVVIGSDSLFENDVTIMSLQFS